METTQLDGRMENREKERGAALVMVLMISFLLLVASAGLLLETSVNTANVTDVIAEQQAFNSAETGIQTTINVLRGNVIPSPLIDATKPSTDPANKMDFVKALKLSTANTTGDTSTVPRLSRWISYNYAPTGVAVADQRVSYGTASYDPITGYAFQVSVSDPDRTGTSNSFSTSGTIDNQGPLKTFTSGANTVAIRYNSENVSDLDVSSGNAATNFGSFQIITLTGGTVSTRARFAITINMTRPYNAAKVLRGWIETGTVSNGSVGTVKLLFDTQTFSLMGSSISLTGGTMVNNMPSSTPRVGYEVTPNPPNTNSGIKVIGATMSQAEPTRLTIRSVGYGPRGSQKQLEAIVKKNFFDGIPAPSTLTMVGRSSGFVFNPGSSAVVSYSGDDAASTTFVPPIGTTNTTNLNTVQDSVDGNPPHPFNGTVVGTPSDISGEVPTWLQNPTNLDVAIQSLRNVAASSGRYFTSSAPPTTFGNNSTAQGITFVDGNLSLSGAGGGILVVTGTLTLSGGFNFNGMIIVTGTGGIVRSGGGNGTIQGAVVIAPYDPFALLDNDLTNDVFLSPRFDLSGGGGSTITFNSSSIANGMNAVSNLVQGVAEK